MERRLGDSEAILVAQGNLAVTYFALGRHKDSLRMTREVYAGSLQLHGEEHEAFIRAANNCAYFLFVLQRFEEAKALLRKLMPVARRVLGISHELTLRVSKIYALALYKDPGATFDDLRESVTTLEETGRTMRRVLGGVHPHVVWIEKALRDARAALRAHAAARIGRTFQTIWRKRKTLASFDE